MSPLAREPADKDRLAPDLLQISPDRGALIAANGKGDRMLQIILDQIEQLFGFVWND